MSVQTEGSERESVVLPPHGDLAFGALMDALAPEKEAEGGSAARTAGTNDGQAVAPAAPAGGTVPAGGSAPVADGGQQSGTPAGSAPASGSSDAATGPDGAGKVDGATGTSVGDPQQPATDSGSADLPSTWTVSADTVIPQLGELSTKFEENIAKSFQQEAYEKAREDYANYFDALEKHPRLLVGTQVPAIGKEGMETLRDTNDAKEWQEAVRSLLVAEIKEAAEEKMGDSQDALTTVHASIDLFKNNRDLIPGTKDFNRELADAFGAMMKPYEVRVEGNLHGYSIPVQPIIENLRSQIAARRQTPTNPPPAAPSPGATAQRPRAEPPQAGIQSKAGSNTEKEDFSVLFGTIGLPNLQI